jgi:hypothetical protein
MSSRTGCASNWSRGGINPLYPPTLEEFWPSFKVAPVWLLCSSLSLTAWGENGEGMEGEKGGRVRERRVEGKGYLSLQL